MSSEEPYDDYEEPRPGLWGRVRRLWGTGEVPEGDEEQPGAARRAGSRRLDPARGQQVSVRLNATVFNDARLAADGLKSGKQQIVNLERASPQMAERILDFLTGVTYALDGTVERIAEKVYLFAPACVSVEVDDGSEAGIA